MLIYQYRPNLGVLAYLLHESSLLFYSGGEGKIGKVLDIRGWDVESGRSVANVSWVSGSTNVYRLGHKGKIDLKYVDHAPGITYYKDHLPVLGRKFLIELLINPISSN